MKYPSLSDRRSSIPTTWTAQSKFVLASLTLAILHVGCGAKPATEVPQPAASATSKALITASNLPPEVNALADRVRKNLRFVEGGSFEMGDFGPLHSPDKLYYSSAIDNKPLHKVTLGSFYMSAYKTVYEDVDVYSRATGKPLVAQDKWTKENYRQPKAGAGLTWFEARAYCQWLGTVLNLPMDLPTEAQWEYAARNRGQFFLFATDNGKVDDGRNVWNFDQLNAARDKLGARAIHPSMPPLGQFPATPLGLYDMMTDGYEWTLDWYAENYYAASPELNPKGPAKGKLRVMRSYPSADGRGLSHGDGMTITRHKRLPDPPKFNAYLNKPDPTENMVYDSMARCVANVNIRPLP